MAIDVRHRAVTLGDLVRPIAIPLGAILLGGALVAAPGPRVLDLAGLAVVGVGFIVSDMATIKRALVAIALIELPLQLDIYLGHDEVLGSIGTVSGFNISVTTFVLVLLYGLWGVEAMSSRRGWRRPASLALLPAAGYFTATLLSALVARRPLVAMYEIVIIFQALLILIYVVHFIRTRRDLLFVVFLTVIGMLIQAFIALVIQQVGSFAFGAFAGGAKDTRVAGTLGSPNVLGSYLALVLGPTLGLALSSAHRSLRFLAGGTLLVGSLALLLTESRGAWVGYGIALTIAIAVAYRMEWVRSRQLLLLAIPMVVMIASQAPTILARLGEFTNPAAQARIPLMELAFKMIQDAPVFGVGANNFSTALSEYLTVEYSQTWIFTVHNKYLLVWVEAGLIALVMFSWFLIAALRRAWRVVRLGDPLLGPLALGLMAGVASNMIHMLVDIFNGRPQTHTLWLVIGTIIALEAMVRRGDGGRAAALDPYRAPASPL